jgi:glycosyltransferase involved in cell wall biosynthesis
MNKPFFSIVTPVYNGDRFLKTCIKSLINQKFKDFEYIVVDGKSTDNTHKIIKKYSKRITKVIIKKDKTMYEALATGFKNSSGKYYMWLNSDDFLIDADSLLNLHNLLINKKYSWVTCVTSIFYQHKKKLRSFFPLIYPNIILKNGLANNCFWGFVQQENTIFSANLYKKVGGVKKNFKMAGDFDMWRRFARHAELKSINIKFAAHRKWDMQLTDLKVYYKEIKKKKCFFNFLYPLRFVYSILLYPIVFFRK